MSVAITESPAPKLASLQPLWHRSAPRRVTKQCPAENPVAGWTAWQGHLRRRKLATPPFLARRGGKLPPLLWGWPGEWEGWGAGSSADGQLDVDRIAASALAVTRAHTASRNSGVSSADIPQSALVREKTRCRCASAGFWQK